MQLDKLRKFIEEQQYKSEPTPQLLQAVGEHMMGVPSRSPEVVRLFLLAHLSTELVRAEVAACHEEMLGLLSQLIEHGQWRGEVRSGKTTRCRNCERLLTTRVWRIGALVGAPGRCPPKPHRQYVQDSVERNGIVSLRERRRAVRSQT
jgi:hypothetical protein